MRGGEPEHGQASVELVAGLPLLLLAGLVALQIGVTGLTLHLADNAAEAGALALAAGRPPGAAAREALPGWARDRVRVQRDGGEVEVHVRPPAPIARLAEALEVTSSAWARGPR